MTQKILIVEDEPAIADTIQYALETEGFATEHLSCGKPVPDRLENAAIDLIILDIGLPDISGIELCLEIRKQSQIPIIFLTARNAEIDRVVGLEIGGDDYVTKPFSPRELAARVRAVLRRGTPPPDSVDPGFPLTLDADRRQIRYGGQVMDLSHYEYRILRTFMQHPGHVYSREQLMDQVWDEPDCSMDRTVDAHIKNLRAKLKAVRPDCDPIVTHRGVGYSLREKF